ncbi:MAG TPA: hypothetical protein VFA77_04470 [Candidatus Eisenbacteria bacterium]|jgi:hypothetical protein|nr:hypothetical protein [Candidatus Eisenbacteria bacterium]
MVMKKFITFLAALPIQQIIFVFSAAEAQIYLRLVAACAAVWAIMSPTASTANL